MWYGKQEKFGKLPAQSQYGIWPDIGFGRVAVLPMSLTYVFGDSTCVQSDTGIVFYVGKSSGFWVTVRLRL